MQQAHTYPIGTPGQKWTEKEVLQWRESRQIQRSYQQEVVTKMDTIGDEFERVQYGELAYPSVRILCMVSNLSLGMRASRRF